ncbi:MAG: sigma-70 family RNA polymerase sigma factor [Clostridia bacterium]|nr:sigma-70 family RNA polymerase sigma factor [Clostridia bacterium]
MDNLERVVGEGYIREFAKHNTTVYGDIMHKYYIDGMSLKEISLHLLLPENQVDQMLKEARSQVVVFLMGK